VERDGSVDIANDDEERARREADHEQQPNHPESVERRAMGDVIHTEGDTGRDGNGDRLRCPACSSADG